MEARRLSADLLAQFTKAADAANRAVMADADEMSRDFVREAEEAKAAVQKDVDALSPLLQSLRYSTEVELLDVFRTRFAEYQELDRTILTLAVENTNDKAFRLAFGPARQAATDFRAALEGITSTERDEWQTKALAATALADVHQIQALQAPHIASPDDAAMTAIEREMAAAETDARTALASLTSHIGPAARSRLAKATAALDRLMAVNKEILALSRRNSDVRSLALSLHEKGKLTAAGESTLRQLQDALAKRGVMGTR